ncbi:MAG: hypothetical protein M1290_03075 [Candidatus Thermoplasmatota archaeon]|nr:hypothetical protein [Candidatus Thermoplasmatota archaeon]MCL5789429.1 hypothetical protein [Candidatus Thermoplasmatota archaeon]
MIKDLEITSIEGRRYAPIDTRPQEVRIDQNLTIADVKKEGEFSRIIYKFTSSFSSLGGISLEGTLLYQGSEDIESRWRKDKSLPETVANEVQTAIFSSSIIETILLARELRLPPPIPMPTLQKKKDVVGFG